MTNTTLPKECLSGLNREQFQTTIGSQKTDLFILKNNKGTEIAFTNYGAAIVAIMTPDRNGRYGNVVLGHDSIESVIHSPEPFLNTTIGRYGNRIAKGRFELQDGEYNLSINNGPNSLHGGPTGFHTRVWDVVRADEHSVELTYTSADGEEGFPGKLTVNMVYALTNDNEFVITYRATTDKPTLCNLTNHAFFNLAGIANPSASVENNLLTINADFYTPIDDVCIPSGEISPVEGTPMDFRTPQTIGSRINEPFVQLVNGAGYDHCYVLNKAFAGELSFAAKCVEPISGRKLEVFTTEPGVQLYTGNWLNGFAGAHGATFPARSAVCFEAQHFPDTPNKPHFPTAVLMPGATYRQTCIYKFGIEK